MADGNAVFCRHCFFCGGTGRQPRGTPQKPEFIADQSGKVKDVRPENHPFTHKAIGTGEGFASADAFWEYLHSKGWVQWWGLLS